MRQAADSHRHAAVHPTRLTTRGATRSRKMATCSFSWHRFSFPREVFVLDGAGLSSYRGTAALGKAEPFLLKVFLNDDESNHHYANFAVSTNRLSLC